MPGGGEKPQGLGRVKCSNRFIENIDNMIKFLESKEKDKEENNENYDDDSEVSGINPENSGEFTYKHDKCNYERKTEDYTLGRSG